MANNPSVPFHLPGRQVAGLRREIEAAIAAVLDSGRYILGTQTQAFEEEFAAYCGAAHCVSVANGTDALEIALRAFGVGTGDEVVTAANAGGYTTIAALAVGATPVYADIDPATLVLDPASAARVVSARTKVVVATHLYGRLADVVSLRTALQRSGSNARIVEDCAQAHGATALDGRHAGTLGDVATFSFYPTKNLGALGDGGALTTDDGALADRLRRLRQYGWGEAKYCVMEAGGRNSRMDELQAAILRIKLRHLDVGNIRRREILARYAEAAADRLLLPHAPAGPEAVVHLCVARSPERRRVLKALGRHGVMTAIHYPIADHLQPAFQASATLWRTGSLIETERACAEIFSLPCYPEMNDGEVVQVCRALAALSDDGPR